MRSQNRRTSSVGHFCYLPLEHIVRVGLDHPNIVAFGYEEQVKTWATGESERARASDVGWIRIHNRVGPCPAGYELRNYAVHAPRRCGAGKRAVSVEAYEFRNGFRLRRATRDNGVSRRREHVQAV